MTDILSQLGAFTNPFGAPSSGEWNLTKGVYTDPVAKRSITFFYETSKGDDPSKKTAIDQITDGGGRRIATYEYPYRDGQRLADLGRKGEIFTFNIKFHGQNYQQKFQEFLEVVVNSNNAGTLSHPVRSGIIAGQIKGALTVRLRDYEFIHRYDEWNAITIKAVFLEDNTDALASTNVPQASQDSALRSSLQTMVNAQSSLSLLIFSTGAALLIPNAIMNSMKQQLDSITGQISRLFGQIAATFSGDAQLQALTAQGSLVTGGIVNLTAGSVLGSPNAPTVGGGGTTGTVGATLAAQLPPVYQVGFDSTTQVIINAQIRAFLNANQITPQQAVFAANQIRIAISAAILVIQNNFGNDGYTLELQYRGIANAVQAATESAIATAQTLVTIFTVPSPMSLRQVAFKAGLTVDDQNVIEALNPFLGSVNYIPTGTQLVVPAT